jgi:hypothetical protein
LSFYRCYVPTGHEGHLSCFFTNVLSLRDKDDEFLCFEQWDAELLSHKLSGQ